MKKSAVALVLMLTMTAAVMARPGFGAITSVDPEKNTIVYKVTFGKARGTEVTANVAKDCVIKEGFYRLGKPAMLKEDKDIPDGLKNAVFKKASAENPVQVNIFTAEEDDKDRGIKKGDVVKILVNPKRKKK